MKEKIIGLRELRENTEEYIRRTRRGEEFIVVRRSEPIFKISAPYEDASEDESEWETIVDFTKLQKGGVSAKKVLGALRKS